MIFLYVGAGMLIFWGVAHLFPTRSVVKGFGEISGDNRHIITMEWLMEAVLMVAIGAFVAAATLAGPGSAAARAVYLVAVIVLAIMAVVSLFTGARIKFLPFRLCPVIFAASAVFIVFGGLL